MTFEVKYVVSTTQHRRSYAPLLHSYIHVVQLT